MWRQQSLYRIFPDHRLIGALHGFSPIVRALRGSVGSCRGRLLLSQFCDSAQGRMPQVKLPFLPRGHHPMVAEIKKCKTSQRTISSSIALTQKANEWLLAHYSRRVLLPSAIALSKEGFALGKAFVECCTRQRAVGISVHGKCFFAECFLSGTWQSLCRVPEKHSAKIYTRQNENAKKPKNNSKIFQNLFFRGRPPPASARPSPSKSLHFLR